jgi:hypothetical protein
MDVYTLGKVDTVTSGRDNLYYGFNVIGIHGRPLANFAFETQKEAEAAHEAMQTVVAKVKVVTAFALA